MSDNNVFVTQIKNNNFFDDMNNLFNLMGIQTNFNLKKISIKINLCDYKMPDSGAVTDPAILESLIQNLELRCPKAEIFITESDASGTKVETLFDLLDLYRFEDAYNCRLVNLTHSEWVKKKINGKYFKEIHVPKLYEESDLIVNHPKLKTHSITKITCSLKNLYGCLYNKYKLKYHNHVDDVIVDLNSAIKTDISIVDANICHEGFQGPAYGTPKRCGLLIGGRNPVSVDSFCSKLMGFNPGFIAHIRKSHNAKIGAMNYKLIHDIADFNLRNYRFEFNTFKYNLMNLFRGRL